MLFLEVDGRGPGEEIRLGKPGTVRVTARAESMTPMTAIEVIVNGKVITSAKASDGREKGSDLRESPAPAEQLDRSPCSRRRAPLGRQ